MKRNPRVRPTTAKVRESLLAILADRLWEAKVLDLFAGSGSLGLACLESGAASVVFVEGDPGVARDLRPRLPRGTRLVQGKLPAALNRVKGLFDLVLADPPYDTPYGLQCLNRLEAKLEQDGLAVFEHHHKQSYPDHCGSLKLVRRDRHGETALSFYARDPS